MFSFRFATHSSRFRILFVLTYTFRGLPQRTLSYILSPATFRIVQSDFVVFFVSAFPLWSFPAILSSRSFYASLVHSCQTQIHLYPPSCTLPKKTVSCPGVVFRKIIRYHRRSAFEFERMCRDQYIDLVLTSPPCQNWCSRLWHAFFNLDGCPALHFEIIGRKGLR